MGIVAYMDMLDGRNYILYYLMAEVSKGTQIMEEVRKMIDRAIEALERMRPEDAVFKDGAYTCVFCSRALNEVYRICSEENAPAAFCPFCGQAQGFKIGDGDDNGE